MRITPHLNRAANLIVEHISDSNANSVEIMKRRKVVEGMDSLITNCLGLPTFSDESLTDNLSMLNFPVNPTSSSTSIEERRNRDVNISFRLGPEDSLQWYLNLCESLSKHSLSIGKCEDSPEDSASAANIIIERISYILAEARLEAIVNNITVNISPNDFFVLGFSTIVREFDDAISSTNLFQQSLLLVKAWCAFEAQSVASIQRVTGILFTNSIAYRNSFGRHDLSLLLSSKLSFLSSNS